MTLKNDAALHNALVRARSKFGTVVLDKKWEDGMKYASLESIECAIRDPLESEGITYHFGDFYGAERMPEMETIKFSREITVRGCGAEFVVCQGSILMEWDPKTNRVADNALEEQEIFSKRILLTMAFALVTQEETPESVERMDRLMENHKRWEIFRDKADLEGTA